MTGTMLRLQRSGIRVDKDKSSVETRNSRMEEDELFTEAVRRCDGLWKVRSRAYKDLRAKENAWKAVAGEVSLLKT